MKMRWAGKDLREGKDLGEIGRRRVEGGGGDEGEAGD